MRLINALLKPFGLIVVPRTSAKMLTESANIVETYWKSTGRTVLWLRNVAEQLAPGGDEYKVPDKRVYRECAK